MVVSARYIVAPLQVWHSSHHGAVRSHILSSTVKTVVMPTVGDEATFRSAVIDSTTTVMVGYLTKPQPVTAEVRPQGTFIQVSTTFDWLCRAVTGVGRKSSPLKPCTAFLAALSATPFGTQGQASANAEAEEDPMQELLEDEESEFTTPKKKKHKKSLTMASSDFITMVPLNTVITDLDIFEGNDRIKVQSGSLCILLKTVTKTALYVLDKHLDLLMLVLLRQVQRLGVPHSNLPQDASAKAELNEWFDPIAAKWCLRVPGSDTIATSPPIPRRQKDGAPIDAECFQQMKNTALEKLKAKYSQVSPSCET